MNISKARELFDYAPLSGKLFWKISPSNSVKKGAEAGLKKDSGYIRIMYKGKNYYAHRVAYMIHYGIEPLEVDHINGVKDDNRASNIRSVAHKDNSRNQKKRSTNTTGYNGVVRKRGKFQSRICVDGETINIGVFDTASDAYKARKKADKKHNFYSLHGDK